MSTERKAHLTGSSAPVIKMANSEKVKGTGCKGMENWERMQRTAVKDTANTDDFDRTCVFSAAAFIHKKHDTLSFYIFLLSAACF